MSSDGWDAERGLPGMVRVARRVGVIKVIGYPCTAISHLPLHHSLENHHGCNGFRQRV